MLQVIKLLKDDTEENDAGIFRSELSLLICWRDNNATALYNRIKELRREHQFTYAVNITNREAKSRDRYHKGTAAQCAFRRK